MDFKIGIDEPFFLFENHFKENSRILFSGKYGSGKTFFLEEYFKRKEDKFNTFWIVPVDYAVSSNEDIFEYIKFDISRQIIPKLPEEIEIKFSEILYLQQFLIHSPLKIFNSFLSAVKIKAKPLPLLEVELNLKEPLEKLPKMYEEFKVAIQEKSKETFSKSLKKHLENQTKKLGSIFEDDIVTQTIRSSLSFFKEQENKENILVIDDLDRLDPEHIFRILNILSSHNNHWGSENKFGFDKIIVVCDVENIKKIFHHKYGKDVDFDGYIDKFYTCDVFHFSNEDGIRLFCQSKFHNDLDESERFLLAEVLLILYENSYITLRKLRKLEFNFEIAEIDIVKKYPVIGDNYLYFNNSTKSFVEDECVLFKTNNFKFLRTVKILTNILGDYKELKKNVSLLVEENKVMGVTKTDNYKNIIESFGLLHHFALTNTNDKLFYTIQHYEGSGRIAHIKYPQYREFHIKLPWFGERGGHPNEVYSTEKCYFGNAVFLPINQKDLPNSINRKDLIETLNEIIIFISSNRNFAKAIGITV